MTLPGPNDVQASSPVDDLVAASADPARVRVVLDRLGMLGRGDGLTPDDAAHLSAVVAVAGASDSLGELVCTDPEALALLARLDAGARPATGADLEPPGLDTSHPEGLARSHRRARMWIAARDLLGLDDLPVTVARLSDLVDRTLVAACALADAGSLTVIAMGKLGAGELNYVSDVDVVLVASDDDDLDERPVRRFLDVAGRCFRVDTALRPGGRDGALVRSVAGFRAHWDRWATGWEFQALLKARAVTGPDDVVRAWTAAAHTALWDRRFGRDDLREVRALKARVEAEVSARGRSDRELKRAPGGIRDIEFSAQLLQLVHGRADPSLRVRDTLGALAQLEAGGYVAAEEAATLRDAYVWFRRIEHRLQLVQERQTHEVPEDRDKRRRIARAAGYTGGADGGPTERFDRDLARHRSAVRRIHEGWYFRPLLEAFAHGRTLPGDASAIRLDAFGFRDAARTEQAVRELSSGLTRSSRLMRQLLPLVLDWLSQGPDPDLGLLALRRLAEGERAASRLATAFRDSAETAQQLCTLVTTSPLVTELLVSNPDLVERLDDPERLGLADRDRLTQGAWGAVGWRTHVDDQRAALRRWHRRQLVGVIAGDIGGRVEPAEVGVALTTLAETVVTSALRLLDPQLPLGVVGLGRSGGRELSYGSDLDLVVVFEGDGTDLVEAERVAAGLLRLVRGTTPATRILDVDLDLRPEGRHGPLARSLDSYTIYLERWAEVWERQALLRARPVGGDVAVGRAFMSLVDHALWTRPPTPADVRSIRRGKARIEAERIPRGVDPRRHLKLGPGGLADVEWTVQLAQWRHGVRRRPTLDALAALVERGAIADADADVLAAAHRHGDRVRNRAHLVLGTRDVLPERPDDLGRLARSLGTTAGALVDEHRRITRRCRVVVERCFYGR